MGILKRIILFGIAWLIAMALKILFAIISILSLYLTYQFFLVENENIFSGDILGNIWINIFAFSISVITLIGVPIFVADNFKGTNLKESLKDGLYYEPFKWGVIMANSLLISVFGGVLGIFSISEFFQISINTIWIKALVGLSIATNIGICLLLEKQKKPKKKKSKKIEYSGFPFTGKEKD